MGANSEAVEVASSTGNIRVGVDDGRWGIKVQAEDGSHAIVPSVIASGHQFGSANGGGDRSCYRVRTEQGGVLDYTVGVDGINTRFPGFDVSDVNAVLLHHALIEAGLGGKKVDIVTGMPLCDYFIGNVVNKRHIDAKIANLKSALVTNMDESVACAVIDRVAVTCEGVCAGIDLMMDAEGNVSDKHLGLFDDGYVGIIDIGGKTTDMACLKRERSGELAIVHGYSGSEEIGTLSLIDALVRRLPVVVGVGGLPVDKVEAAIRTNEVRHFGKRYDVTEVVDEEKLILAKNVMAAARRKMGADGGHLGAVVLVGGGSLALKEQIQRVYPEVLLADDPQNANARGMLKTAMYLL